MWPMVATEFVKARLPLELKKRVKALAEYQFLSESAWLMRLVVREVQTTEGAYAAGPAGAVSGGMERDRHRPREAALRHSQRVYVRLRGDDRLLLEARAQARGMRPATYVSVLTRCHLKQLAPLPKPILFDDARAFADA